MDFSKVHRIVVKVGTSSLTYSNGKLNIKRIQRLVEVLSDIKNSGRDVIFVTSGAIGVGVGRIGLTTRPRDIPTKQACAAIGQSDLMSMYDREFSKYNHVVAQILVTRDVISNKIRRENVENTFKRLLELGAIPIINANDSISIEQLDFDENDTLSAMVAILSEADLLIMLTDVDGLYDKNPSEPDAKLIKQVDKITSEMIASVSGKGSELASGGMLTKLEAASMAKAEHIPSVIMKSEPESLYKLLDNEAVCTLFTAD